MQTMKAIVKLKPEPGIWMDQVPFPRIGHNDVLIKILETAICGTDIHIFNWDAWSQQTIPTPMTIGHEFVGVIAEIAVREGQTVRSGQELARLDDRKSQLEELLARTQLEIANEKAASGLATDLAEKKLAQQRQLAKQHDIDFLAESGGNPLSLTAVNLAVKILRGEPVPKKVEYPVVTFEKNQLDKYYRPDLTDQYFAVNELPEAWIKKHYLKK